MKFCRNTTLIMAAVSLTACDAIHDNVNRANQTIYNESNETRLRLASYIQPKKQDALRMPPPLPEAFCYDVVADIVCYTTPQQHMRNKRLGVGGEEYAQHYGESYAPSDIYPDVDTYALDPDVPDATRSTPFIPEPPQVTGETIKPFPNDGVYPVKPQLQQPRSRSRRNAPRKLMPSF
jgi:hypothetical protein